MKKVYSSDNLVMAGHVKSLLELENIECIIKNENLTGGIGELPPVECWPEVWIINDDKLPEAESVVRSVLDTGDSDAPPWQCQCGETIEGQFGACWNCGAVKE